MTIHTTTRDIQRSDTTVVEGIRISNATRSIVDSADYGTAPEQVISAVKQALDRGLTTKSRLLDAAKKSGSQVRALIGDAIETTNKR